VTDEGSLPTEPEKGGKVGASPASQDRAASPSGLSPASGSSRSGITDAGLLDDIAVMMSEFVDNWPPHKKIGTSIALIAKTLRASLDPEGARDETCVLRKKGRGFRSGLDTVICGQATVEPYLRQGYVFDWEATDKARATGALDRQEARLAEGRGS
jgi:hypothetical protein